MDNLTFVKTYVNKFLIKKVIKRKTDQQVFDIAFLGKPIPLEEMFNDKDLKKTNIGDFEIFVYQFCRDNQKLFKDID